MRCCNLCSKVASVQVHLLARFGVPAPTRARARTRTHRDTQLLTDSSSTHSYRAVANKPDEQSPGTYSTMCPAKAGLRTSPRAAAFGARDKLTTRQLGCQRQTSPSCDPVSGGARHRTKHVSLRGPTRSPESGRVECFEGTPSACYLCMHLWHPCLLRAWTGRSGMAHAGTQAEPEPAPPRLPLPGGLQTNQTPRHARGHLRTQAAAASAGKHVSNLARPLVSALSQQQQKKTSNAT